MSAVISPDIKKQFFDLNGDPLASGKLYVYEAGTTTPVTSYTTEEADTANANPVILDSRGEIGGLFLNAGSYKFVLKDSDDVTIWTVDNITIRNFGSEIDSLDLTVTALSASLSSLDNRVVSGKKSANSNQSLFLKPAGNSDQLTVEGATTNLVHTIKGTQYTLSTDVVASGLTTAPSSNNTALVNNADYADQEYTKTLGEFNTVIPYDTAGSEITGLDGKLAAFKVVGVSTEYFIARIDNANSQLINAKRGYFFDSSNAPIKRTAFTNNDTITLAKLTWVFLGSDGVVRVTYNEPIYGAVEPSSPSVGDIWFDTINQIWKRFNSTVYSDDSINFIGLCIQDENGNTVGARSEHFYVNQDETNTVELVYLSATQVRSKFIDNTIGIFGTTLKPRKSHLIWDITADLESGLTEAASTTYHFYIKENGGVVVSDVPPMESFGEIVGLYHSYETWRYVGKIFNNSSSNFDSNTIKSNYNSLVQRAELSQGAVGKINYASGSTTITLLAKNDHYELDASGGAFTATLPPVLGLDGQKMTLRKNSDDFTVITIDGDGSETVGGNSGTTLNTLNECVELLCDEANKNWIILRRDIPNNLKSFTPTGTWSTNTTHAGFLWREGEFLCLDVQTILSGAPDSANYRINIPGSLSVNEAKMQIESGGNGKLIGHCYVLDSGTGRRIAFPSYEDSNDVVELQYADTGFLLSTVTNTTPQTFASGDKILWTAKLPIDGWNS